MKSYGGTALVLGFGAALILIGVSCGSPEVTAGLVPAMVPGGSGSPDGGGASPKPSPSSSAPATRSVPYDPRTPSIGMNLNGVSYYSPQWAFVDAMKMSRVNALSLIHI